MASRSVYVHDTMQDMLDAYNDYGCIGIAHMIPDLDQDYSPHVRVSRLSTPVVVEHTMLLLSQLGPDIIRSLLANTLVEDVVAGTVPLHDWNNIPRLRKAVDEPGIYVNYFTKSDGTGLTVNEYDEWVDIMCAILREQSYKNETPAVMAQRVNNYFNTNTTSSKVVDLVEDVLNSVKLRYDKRGSPIHPTIDLNTFESSQRKIVTSARSQNATEIRFFGEVGWAINVDDRVKTHANLQGSAGMFRLAMCVIGAYFPTYKFRMTSYCLFRVAAWMHAEMGETLGSHLVSSYGKYGGFNFTTAGISVESSSRTDVLFWRAICIQYEDMIKYSDAQVAREVDDLRKRNKQQEVSKQSYFAHALSSTVSSMSHHELVGPRRRQGQCDTRIPRYDTDDNADWFQDELELIRAYKKLEIEGAELDNLVHKLDADRELETITRRTGRKFEALKATVESKEREATKCQAQLNSFATNLNLKPISSTQATPYIERGPTSSALHSTQATPANPSRR
ncbi:unnamed protein product [Aureobasidium mustum]|uniref:Uncharacterized protein n=1 Tax=Aureobasidium mustum TaxID=2773714 RepID=A0A9N8JV09_9PEZI|nr:unnamed protein product [Aureobasidium mustum]